MKLEKKIKIKEEYRLNVLNDQKMIEEIWQVVFKYLGDKKVKGELNIKISECDAFHNCGEMHMKITDADGKIPVVHHVGWCDF